MLWISYHKLLTTADILAHRKNWWKWAKFVGYLARICLFRSAPKLSIGLRYQGFLMAMPKHIWKPFWDQFALGHCTCGRPICAQSFTSWLMCWNVAWEFPHSVLFSCLFFFLWSVSVPPAAKQPHHIILPLTGSFQWRDIIMCVVPNCSKV